MKKYSKRLMAAMGISIGFILSGALSAQAYEGAPQTMTVNIELKDEVKHDSQLYKSVISEVERFSENFLNENSRNGICVYPYSNDDRTLSDFQYAHEYDHKKITECPSYKDYDPFTSDMADIRNDLDDMEKVRAVDEYNALYDNGEQEYEDYDRRKGFYDFKEYTDWYKENGKFYDYSNNLLYITDTYKRPEVQDVVEYEPAVGDLYVPRTHKELVNNYNTDLKKYYNVYVIYIGTSTNEITLFKDDNFRNTPLLVAKDVSELGERLDEVLASINDPFKVEVSDEYNSQENNYKLSLKIINENGKELRNLKTELELPEGLSADKASAEFDKVPGYSSDSAKADFVITPSGDIKDKNARINIKVSSPVTATVSTEYELDLTKLNGTEEVTSDGRPDKVVSVSIGSRQVTIGTDVFEMDAAPYIQAETNSTLVPLRFVAIAIGGGSVESAESSDIVSWDPATKTARISANGKTVSFSAGSNTMVVDGQETAIDGGVRPEITDSRMYIPFRVLGNVLGVDVDWDNSTKTAFYK